MREHRTEKVFDKILAKVCSSLVKKYRLTNPSLANPKQGKYEENYSMWIIVQLI
jgi:hypothetical protein